MVCSSAHLPACQRVTKLMQRNDQEQREILHHIPGNRGIAPLAAADFISRNQKPGPMQEYIDSGKPEEVDRTLAAAWHLQESTAPAAQLPHEPK